MITSNVKAIMKREKMTVQGMVWATRLSSATIHRAQQNRGIMKCRLETLARIAAALEVPLATLFAGEYKLGASAVLRA